MEFFCNSDYSRVSPYPGNICLSRKCCLLITSAAHIQLHSDLVLSSKQTILTLIDCKLYGSSYQF